MSRILCFLLLLFLTQNILAQEISIDSIQIKSKSCYRPKSKIKLILENHTGVELLRTNPMAPLQLFKWDGKKWNQVTQVGYCSCGILSCPPPPEYLPLGVNEVVEFEWDQMESRCVDMQKGIKEYKWSGRGKYKVVFEFQKQRYSDSFRIEKAFKIH